MNILIVEDDRGLASLICDIVTDCGFVGTCVFDGRAAIEYLSANSPYLMILDYSLTDMKASDLLGSLKKENINIPPFMVSTGQGDERPQLK